MRNDIDAIRGKHTSMAKPKPVSTRTAPSESDAQPGSMGEYSAFLERRLTESRDLKRSAKTRLTLLIGAARALNAQGMRLATVESIVQAAGLSHSTFYLHFPSKNAIAAQVLVSFMDDMAINARVGPPPRDDYERASRATLNYVRSFRANPGMARSVLQLNDEEDPVLDEARSKFGEAWYSHSAHSMLKHFPNTRISEPQLNFAISAMGGMIDDFLRRWVVHRQPDVIESVNAVAPTDEALAEALTVLWWRALVGEPPHTDSAAAAALASGLSA
jgi:TetR/AcrR family transcriptional repressor of nem operon